MDETPTPDTKPDAEEEDRARREAPQPPPAKIAPAGKPTPERPDHLRRREDWFKKRSSDAQ